jgi:two-component system, NarL family, response regulator DesR
MTEDANSTNQSGAGCLRVYLAEDSAIMQGLLRDLLTNESGVDVVGRSGDARVASGEITELAPDVAIVDIALENGSGFDVLKALSAVPKAQRPVVIVLTNFSLPRYRAEASRLGVDYFFDKNGEIVALLKTIGAIAASRRRRNGSEP